MFNIPAHYFWPGFIIALLCLSIGLSFTGLYFAQSDGGPQIVPDYYEKSVDFDDTYEIRQASIELGWQTEVEFDGSSGVLVVTDDSGEPVENAEGEVTFYRPDRAASIASVELVESADEPGHYRFDDVTDRPGFWDLAVELHRGDDAFVQSVRTSVDS